MNNLTFQIVSILKHNRDGSFATQNKRSTVLKRAACLLWEKFPRLKLQNLKRKHLDYLIEFWKDHKSIKTELSHIRWLLQKIDKEYLLPRSNDDLGIPRRIMIANENKTWIGKVDIREKIQNISKENKTAGYLFQACLLFGLRFKEAALFCPHENTKEDRIEVFYGTKGGRRREVEIISEKQRNFLKEIRKEIKPGRSLIPPHLNFVKFKNFIYYVARKYGIKKENGLTIHGLRHSYCCTRYEDITGEPAPILRTGSTDKEIKKDQHARELIAKEVGHGRSSVTSAYIGGKR